MSASELVIIEVGPGNTAWVRGDGHLVHPAIRAARSPKLYDPQRRALAIPIRFVDDVAAALELQSGVDVRVEQVLA